MTCPEKGARSKAVTPLFQIVPVLACAPTARDPCKHLTNQFYLARTDRRG
jgi:hypothetical protein